MIRRSELERAKKQAAEILSNVGVVLRPDELEKIVAADFGLSELWISGVQILTLVDTEQIAAKLLIQFPNQTEPEHLHPPVGNYAGKEETIRCEWGEFYLYTPGEPTPNPRGCPPAHRRHTYTVWHEQVMHPGDQMTFAPGVPHWFQAGPQGTVMWSFSTKVVDAEDVFTDPDIRRITVIEED
jgi:D-lyxose ketol-isomerase